MHNGFPPPRRTTNYAVAALLAASSCRKTSAERLGRRTATNQQHRRRRARADAPGLRFDSAKFSISVEEPAAASSSTLTTSQTRNAPKGAEDFPDTDSVGVDLSYTDKGTRACPAPTL